VIAVKRRARWASEFTTLSLHLQLTITKIGRPPNPVNNECLEVDELILELTDYKNDLADMAAEKLFRKCSTSWEAYQYLRDRVGDAWLSNSARQQVRRIIKRIQVQIHQSREYGWAWSSCEYSARVF
jgi:hypothetical protein